MVEAEFLDIFGFMAFIYITIISTFFLRKKNVPENATIILLIIGILGIIVDGLVIITTYFIK